MDHSFLIEAEELAREIGAGDVLLIDARKADAYARGHLPGAGHLTTYDCFVPGTTVDGMKTFAANMAARYGAAGASRGRPIVVYEDDTGMRAARELWILEYLGHRNARMLHGGLVAWRAAGGAITTEAPSAASARFEPQVNSAVLISADEINGRAKSPGLAVLDVRDRLEYNGKDRTACCTRHGRVPGAVWLEWTALLEDGRFKSPDAIRALLAARGINPDDELAPYCHRGARSANTYYALRYAGCTKVRNFIGSWHEWSARAELPLEI